MTNSLDGGRGRTKVRRLPEKQVDDRAVLYRILDAARVAHVGLTDSDGQLLVVPVAFGRDGEHVIVHGSTGSRLFHALAVGERTCLTVTLLDGLVLARSAFESSMHYRSVMVFGSCEIVPDADTIRCLRVLTDRLMPGRWAELRPPTAKEIAATMLLRLPLVEWSVKVSDGWAHDPSEDLAEPVWAGVLPITSAFGSPLPAPDLRAAIEPPGYINQWLP